MYKTCGTRDISRHSTILYFVREMPRRRTTVVTRVCAAALQVIAFHYWSLLSLHTGVAFVGRAGAAVIHVVAVPKSSHVPIVHPVHDSRPQTPDMIACLWSLSYTCVQRKTAVYLDALNRMDQIPLVGDFVTAVRTQPVDDNSPAISENLLEARGFNSVLSLSYLVNSVVQSIVREHTLKISFSRLAELGASYGLVNEAAAASIDLLENDNDNK